MYRFFCSSDRDFTLQELRVALFNFILAYQNSKQFIIKITDKDPLNGNVESLLKTLQLFGIKCDQVLYQNSNLKFYRQLTTKLLTDSFAFSCFCTDDIIKKKKERAKSEKRAYKYDKTCQKLTNLEILENNKPFCIRIKRAEKSIKFHDIIKGKIEYKKEQFDDFIILDNDKKPLCNFSAAIDDMLLDTDLIIDSEENISNTINQIMIREYLGYDKKIEYAHIPNILNDDININPKSLLDKGYLPSAIVNYLILLGNKTNKEVFTLSDALTWFSLKNISDESVKFDILKLNDINVKHILRLDPLTLSSYLRYSNEEIGNLAKLYTKEFSTISELKVKIDTIFNEKITSKFPKELQLLKDCADNMPYFEKFDDFYGYLRKKSGLKDEVFTKTLKILLTGNDDSSLKLKDVYPYIKNYLGEIIK